MRVVVLSDIHGRSGFGKNAFKAIADAELVVVPGDITNFGGSKDARAIIHEIKTINDKIVAIPGNCDYHEIIDLLRAENINLHGESRQYENIMLFGVGGSGKTPFGTPQEYSDSEIAVMLKSFVKKKEIQRYVLVSHDPPANTKVDRTMLGMHAGNKIIREFIEVFQPDLCICGHIHEARGEDMIGRTLIINPGPFPRYYALVEINDTISYQLIEA